MKLKRSLVQIYTGNGKGKTTAAMGLAVRAVGAGLKVSIHQFIKGRRYSEIETLSKIKNIKVSQCGRGCFIKGKPKVSDIECAVAGLACAREDMMSSLYDIVILDEINVALKCKLLKVKDVISFIESKPRSVELVLTGRYCPRSIMRLADLITDMREVRHPYRRGIKSRLGIEC